MKGSNSMASIVSIIIPAYNTEAYIHRAIESSLRQTYPDIEIVVVDDGSTDSTLKIAQGYDDKRIKVLHQDNKGVSNARNNGIREAKGKYVMFLDSDDWLEDDSVEVLMNLQLKYPNKLVGAGTYYVGISKDKKAIYRSLYFAETNQENIFNIRQALDQSGSIDFPSACYKFFERQLLLEHNIFFPENVSHSEDSLFVFEYMHHIGSMVRIDTAIWNTLPRQGSAQHSSYSHKRAQSMIEVNDIKLAYYQEASPERDILVLEHVNIMLAIMINALLNNTEHEEIAYIKKNVSTYMNEITSSKRLSRKKKFSIYCKMLLPECLLKQMVMLWRRFKRRFIKEKANPQREILPYW